MFKEDQEPETLPITLTPEAIVEALRAVRAQMGELAPLRAGERKKLVRRITGVAPILQTGINTVGATEVVSNTIGKRIEEVQQMADEAGRWTAVEAELRAMLMGISGANVLRQHRVALVAAQAAAIAQTLTLDPKHADLIPQVLEISRLRSYRRRKKTATEV